MALYFSFSNFQYLEKAMRLLNNYRCLNSQQITVLVDTISFTKSEIPDTLKGFFNLLMDHVKRTRRNSCVSSSKFKFTEHEKFHQSLMVFVILLVLLFSLTSGS